MKSDGDTRLSRKTLMPAMHSDGVMGRDERLVKLQWMNGLFHLNVKQRFCHELLSLSRDWGFHWDWYGSKIRIVLVVLVALPAHNSDDENCNLMMIEW